MSTYTLNIEPGLSSEALLITPRSHLTDQHLPECEIVALPAKPFGGGTMSYGLQDMCVPPPDPPRRVKLEQKLTRLGFASKQRTLTGTFIDLRLRSPQNWAHFLTNHLPIFFGLCEKTGLAWSDVTILLPKDTPRYILDVVDMFDLKILCTEDTVCGTCLHFDPQPWTAIRAYRRDWAQLPSVKKALQNASIDVDGVHIPKKVFVARRKTRLLENNAEVEASLAARGFKTLFLEDLSVPDQFRVFEHAVQIVAIHGAGFAPLLYRSLRPERGVVIELLPCGIMTDVFRVISGLAGCDWIGVRGKIKPSYIKDLYDLEAPFLSAANDDFEIDIASLDLAFEKVLGPSR